MAYVAPCRTLAFTVLVISVMSSVTLWVQFHSSHIYTVRKRSISGAYWRWEEDELVPGDNSTNSSQANGEHTEDNRVLCSVYNYTAVCRVHIIASSRTNGSVTVNNKVIYSWVTAPELIVIRISNECRPMDIVVWSKDNRTHEKFKTMSEYFNSLPNKSILLGAGVGASAHLRGLIDLGISSRNLKNVNPVRGIYSFLGWKGYPGHVRYKMSPKGESPCTLMSHFFVGVPFKYSTSYQTYSMALAKHPDLTHGGFWEPRGCRPRWRVAVIVPFRRRDYHLHVFVENMISFLKQQKIAFNIFIIEQAEPELFNRAALMNVGYLEASKVDKFGCFAFHDVDLVPEDLSNMYACSVQPRHLVVTRSVRDYRLRKTRFFGGGILMSPASIDRINGFPNQMFGWGGEDDAIYTRVKFSGANILRYPLEIARYVSLPHGRDEGNPHMKRKLPSIDRQVKVSGVESDGLNNINYTILAVEKRSLYTHIFVHIPGPTTPKEARHFDTMHGYNKMSSSKVDDPQKHGTK